MFKKTFIALGLLLICCCQQAIAQTEIDCQLLKKKIDYATANSTSFSINYVSNSRKIYIHYEEDSIDNKHFIYTNYGEENSERALIWIKNKVYWTKRKASNDSSAVDWSDQLSIYFNYDEWIDSCKSAKSIFNQPLICTFKDNILVSGTPFDIFGIKIEKDTFKVWLNKKTDKIEKIQGENKQRDIHFDWLFDVPFTIKSPTNISNEEKNFGLYTFSPRYSYEPSEGTERVFDIVDKNPEYKGGEKEMYKAISYNIKYPASARENGHSGNVYIGFIIEKDGTTSNFTVKRGFDVACEEESIRVAKLLSGNWEAGVFNGQKVRTTYTLPFRFRLE